MTITLAGAPKDLRLDAYLSIVDTPGNELAVIQKSTIKALYMKLNPDNAPFGEILGGHFSPDFIVFHIRNDRETFLQIHTSKQ